MAKKQDKLNRVPPFLPIIWQDWESSLDIQSMTLLEVGFFVTMLLKLWVLDELPAEPRKLAKMLRADRRTVANWLRKYSALVTYTQRPCSVHAASMERTPSVPPDGCPDCALTLHNEKLRNLKIDVKSGLDLGTTEPNQTEPEPEPEPESTLFIPSEPSQTVDVENLKQDSEDQI